MAGVFLLIMAGVFLLFFIIFSNGNFSGYTPNKPKLKPMEGYHDILYDDEIQHLVGIKGAITYLLDKNVKPITKGFHSYFRYEEAVYGVLGSRIAMVIDRHGNKTDIKWGVEEDVMNFYKRYRDEMYR